MGIFFGTDGVRGIANKELTNELTYKLGRFGARVIAGSNKKAKIIVGKDTRISGDMLESSLISGILSSGCDVISVGIVPTPAIPLLVKKFNAGAGVMISASHNPVEYNGIKFFSEDGYKLPDSVEDEIEAYIINNKDIENIPLGKEIGIKTENFNGLNIYREFIKATVDIDFKGLKVAIDGANGSAYKVAKETLDDLGAKTYIINNIPNGTNINDNCGSTHLEGIKKFTLENKCDIGLAFDGDADRLLAIDENGNLVDGDKIMAICGNFMSENNMLKNNTIVTTVMSNLGFDIALKEKSINSVKTKVGDRYVLEEMKRGKFSLGGEQSGHVIFFDYNTTGDGLLTAVQIISVMKKKNKSLSKLAEIMDIYPQVLLNAVVSNELKSEYLNCSKITKKIDEIRNLLNGEGRVLIRPSGTEPLIRVMLEGKNQEQLNLYAKDIVEVIENNLV